jgi:hypothetical protein
LAAEVKESITKAAAKYENKGFTMRAILLTIAPHGGSTDGKAARYPN